LDNGQTHRRGKIGRRRVDSLIRLYRQLETEWAHAISDVRTLRDGCGADDDIDVIADMLTSRMEQIVHHRVEVGDALERLAAGTYGLCEDCGKRIPAARLEANPAAIRCVGCQKQAEWRSET
jgi:DnaK suppressor protein